VLEESEAKLGTVVKLKSFTEKPNLEKAKQFLAAGNYFWNSGIFVWSMNGIKTAFDTYLPEIVEVFDRGKDVFATVGEQEFINANFADCTNISIDYGVMEKSPNTYTIPANFGWSDIGTWGSLFNHAAKDINNNAVAGKVVLVNTNGTIVNIQEGVEAVVQGLENYLVAYRDNSLLICKLTDEQKIKEWIAEL
jgi:mannose-1-phosphate guanylyltransferase